MNQTILSSFSDDFMTVTETAAYLNISPGSVYRLIQHRRLPIVTFKTLRLIPTDAVILYQHYKREKMALYTRENQYQGINPHLTSLQQIPDSIGRWKGFHHSYIENIHDFVNECLPAGYRAWIEDTLSIVTDNDTYRPKYPDVLITHKKGTTFSTAASISGAALPDMTLEIPYDEHEADAVVIYKLDESDLEARGIPVTAIELLSPSNKVATGRTAHIQKREQLLKTGVAVVEIDILHALPATHETIPHFPMYPHAEGAKPYYIAVANPRTANLSEKRSFPTDIYFFGINQPMPTINIPLLEGQQIPVDFDVTYQTTFQKKFFGELVDYHKEPVRMEKYTPSDQAVIRETMRLLQERFSS